MLDNVLSDVVWRRRWYRFYRIHHSNSLMIDASHALTRCTLNCGIGLGFSVGWPSFAETSSAFRISSEGHTLTLTCCVRLADFRCWTSSLQKLVTPFQQFGFSEDTVPHNF